MSMQPALRSSSPSAPRPLPVRSRFRAVFFAALTLGLLAGLPGEPADARCRSAGGRVPAVPPPVPPPEEEPERPTPPTKPTTPPPTTPPPTEEPTDPEPPPSDDPRDRPTTPPGDTPRPGRPPDDDPRDRPTTPPAEDPAPEPEAPPADSEPPTTPPSNPVGQPTPPPTPQVPGATPTTGAAAPEIGGRRRGRSASASESIEWKWSTWWAFNRWNYLPSRNDVLRRGFKRFRVVTGEGAVMLDAWDKRRDALGRARAAPALQRIMRADLRPGDLGLKAAAALGLARVSTSRDAVEDVLVAAEDESMIHEVREAAVWAAGLFRRTDPERQMSGERADALRARLFRLADKPSTPRKVACMAIMAVGMLGDQPRAGAVTSGVRETHGLWRRLLKTDQGTEFNIAYLTALGMQPAAAAGETVTKGLLDITVGKRFGKRKWSARERSHALCTLVRLSGRSGRPALVRLMANRRISTPVRRAAFITLGERAAEFDAEGRKDLVKAWEAAAKASKDPLTRGLGLIALGRILGADLRAKDGGRVLRSTPAAETLLRRVKTSAQNTRGFAVLGLALALREARGTDNATKRFQADARKLILWGFERSAGNALSRGPYTVALGLAGIREALPALEKIVVDPNEDRQLRAYAAVACGQIGTAGPSTVFALKKAVADYHLGNLRLEAALGLAYLTGDRDAQLLREDIERRRYTHSHQIGHVAIALGQMGDLRAIVPLSKLVLDEKSDHGARGAAAVALGLLCDPEKQPSMTRLWQDVNYPARSIAMHEALNYL